MGFFTRVIRAIDNGLHMYVGSIKESCLVAFKVNDDGLAESRRKVLGYNTVANIVALMINGNFYTGLLLMVLRDVDTATQNAYIGTVASIATACAMVQIFAPAFIERLKTFKKYVLACRVVYYFFNVVGLVIVPMLPFSTEVNVAIFIGIVVVMNVSAAIQSPAISVWHLQSLPENRRADYFSIYNMAVPLVNAVTGILFSLFVDQFKAQNAELMGILILRGLAVLVILGEFKLNAGIWDPPRNDEEKLSIVKIFTAPLRHPRFLIACVISAIWTFACGIQGQYFSVYLLQDAQASYTFLQFVSIFSLPCLLISIPIWNRIIKKIGWLYTMSISLVLYSFPQLFNMLINGSTLWIYPVLCFYSNLVVPGLNLAITNLPYQRCPDEAKSSCLAFYATVGSLGTLAGNLFGKFFVELTEGKYIYMFGFEISNRLYHFFISFTLFLGLALMIFLVQRHEDRKDKLKA